MLMWNPWDSGPADAAERQHAAISSRIERRARKTIGDRIVNGGRGRGGGGGKLAESSLRRCCGC